MGQSTKADSDDERCDLCQVSGPPTFASIRSGKSSDANNADRPLEAGVNGQDAIDDVSNLVWIACSRCTSWYHSCCLLLARDDIRETIPKAVRVEAETSHSDEAPFFDWTIWIDRWYVSHDHQVFRVFADG